MFKPKHNRCLFAIRFAKNFCQVLNIDLLKAVFFTILWTCICHGMAQPQVTAITFKGRFWNH